MKNIKIVIFTIILFFTFFFPLKADWTYMVYIAADNSLSSAVQTDINEMKTASNSANVDIIVLKDQNAIGDSKILKITFNTETDITPHSASWWPADNELNTDDWNIANNFFLWAMQNYPSDHYAITFWNHGGGIFKDNKWKGDTKSICWDDNSGLYDYIDQKEVKQILSNLYSQNSNNKIDLIGYDVCLLGALETSYQAKDYAHICVASGANEPNNGWDWTFLDTLTTNPNLTARELGWQIVDYFGSFYNPGTKATLAAIDLDTLDNIFIPYFQSFSKELYNQMYSYTSDIRNIRGACSEAINPDTSYGGPMIDFYDFADRISNSASLPNLLKIYATNARNGFNRSVINCYSAQVTFNGASIWFPEGAPYCGLAWAGDNWDAYNSMLDFHNTYWDEFLLEYATPTTGTANLVFTSPSDTVKIVYPLSGMKNKIFNNTGSNRKLDEVKNFKKINLNLNDLYKAKIDLKRNNTNKSDRFQDSLCYHSIWIDLSVWYYSGIEYNAVRFTAPYRPTIINDISFVKYYTTTNTYTDTLFVWYDDTGIDIPGTLQAAYTFDYTPASAGVKGIIITVEDTLGNDTIGTGDFWIGTVAFLSAPISYLCSDTTTVDNSWRNYWSHDRQSWGQLGNGDGDWGIDTYISPATTDKDSGMFYIKNDPSSTRNLEILDMHTKNGSRWIQCLSYSKTPIPPGDSTPVYIGVDTVCFNNVYDIYYDDIVVQSNASNGLRANLSIPILLDYNTGQHSGISTIVNRKLTSKLSLIATKNPFIHTTDLRFALPSECDVNITIYDISGKKLNELTNKKYTAGIYKIKWDGKDSNGKTLPNGFYFAKMTTGNKSLSTKIIKLH